MEYDQIPADRPHLKIALRFDLLEVGEKARCKRVDCQDTKRESANVHESAVYHWAISSNLHFKRISKGLCKGVAACSAWVPLSPAARVVEESANVPTKT
jgi:hypothetical protein